MADLFSRLFTPNPWVNITRIYTKINNSVFDFNKMYDDQTILMYAIEQDLADLFNFLCNEKNAHRIKQIIDKTGRWGWTALMFAAENGNVGMVNKLIYLGANAEIKCHMGNTAADIAAINGHYYAFCRLKK